MPDTTTTLNAPAQNGETVTVKGRPPRPKLKKLRLLFVVLPLAFLALVSTVFGMMMAVASDLPSLENAAEYRAARNSELFADARDPVPLAKLTGNQNRILAATDEISPNIKNAVIAIEDRRFFTHEGVDYRGIARALWQDIKRGEAAQGGSTITQQFVKNALKAQGDRSVFQKLRESALAYHLERQWDKEKILTQYLNTIYFGNGAYGVESAVRTYFGEDREFDPDYRAARSVSPAQAALLAGIIASPSAYDPIQNPRDAKARRDLVLLRMLEQGHITKPEYDQSLRQVLPTEDDIHPPRPDSKEPYFSTWVTQQLVDRYGAGRVFGGGLKVTTTLDPKFQAAARAATNNGQLFPEGPNVALVAIENRTGAVKAMIGGTDYDEKPFNIATNGHRQPGSAFKPFILIGALEKGVGPGAVFSSRPKEFTVPNTGGKEKFKVANYEDQYSGSISLAGATANSDNSVYAELGVKVIGTRRVARLAERMGIRTEVSTNPAMTLGGLKEGVTPLEMAFAYATIANRGKRVCSGLASSRCGPVAIKRVRNADGKVIDELKKKPKTHQIYRPGVGEQARQILSGVVRHGTGTRAQLGNEFVAGKTGTTENYGDAWFVGFTDKYTVAVWVGYADKLKPMETEYGGKPVAGGTYPADVWRKFMTQVLAIEEERNPDKDETEGEQTTPGLTPPPATPQQEGGTEPAPAPEEQPAPAPEPEPTPAPEPEPAPEPPPAVEPPAAPPPPAPNGGGGGATPE